MSQRDAREWPAAAASEIASSPSMSRRSKSACRSAGVTAHSRIPICITEPPAAAKCMAVRPILSAATTSWSTACEERSAMAPARATARSTCLSVAAAASSSSSIKVACVTGGACRRADAERSRSHVRKGCSLNM
eukprot:scaffold3011_cov32-Tisochrysis_lutea.AAC.3